MDIDFGDLSGLGGAGGPPYRRIVGRIRLLIVAGRLAGGDRLPAVRELAGQLGVNPMTVARAYRELAGLGLVQARQRKGVFVTLGSQDGEAGLSPADRRAARASLAELLDEAAAVAWRLGLPKAELSAMLAERYAAPAAKPRPEPADRPEPATRQQAPAASPESPDLEPWML
ncbi:MAG: hypothetical protein BIFFINMI_03417 [Phycisphaerae bacterium]|nr:hypothetical protein [Phycisphaerae bacterium]